MAPSSRWRATEDGVNDAPALAQADIGIAMSLSAVSVIGNALRLRVARL